MTIVYIRHGEDEIGSERTKHDGPLTKDGVKKTMKLGKKLLKKYGEPDVIYCSPFYRTWQTAEILSKLSSKPVKIEVDIRLTKYFTSSQQNNPKIRKDTKEYRPPVRETKDHVWKRAEKQLRSMKKQRLNVWCVTHGIVFKYICQIDGASAHGNIPFLEYYHV